MIQINGVVDGLRSDLSEITRRSVSEYIRKETLGTELSFEKGARLFEQLIAFCERLSAASLENAPTGLVTEIRNMVATVRQRTTELMSFTATSVPMNNAPSNYRDQLFNNLLSSFTDLYRMAAPVVALNDASQATLEDDLRESKGLVSSLRAERQQTLNDATDTKRKIDDILTSAQEAAGKIGVAANAKFFENEVKTNARAANFWLVITAALAIGTLLFSLGLIFPYKAPTWHDAANLWQPLISRLVALSVLYYALVWSSRNYFALQHNVIVNRHRQNALSTFQTFVESATDEPTKNHVLLKATESIFAPEVSGYLTKEPDPRPSSQVLEVIGSALHR